jgi:hypothetical protein
MSWTRALEETFGVTNIVTLAVGQEETPHANKAVTITSESEQAPEPDSPIWSTTGKQKSIVTEDLPAVYLRERSRSRISQVLAKDEAASSTKNPKGAEAGGQSGLSRLRDTSVGSTALEKGLENLETQKSPLYDRGCPGCKADGQFQEHSDEETIFNNVRPDHPPNMSTALSLSIDQSVSSRLCVRS